MQSAQHKKLYEFALSSGQSIQSLDKALSSVLRLAIGDHTHFNFLLHNINWFSEPYINHISILEKALRMYRGRGKQSEKVVYNILTDGMWSSAAWKKASDSLINLIKPGFDFKLVKQSLRGNYPHKVTQLQMQQNYLMSLLHIYKNCELLRFDTLEIIMLQMASFDTELCTEELNQTQIFPSDSELKGARAKLTQSPEYIKFDTLISQLLDELSQINNNDGKLFQELLLIFKNDLVLIDNTKYIQFVLYFFAEASKKSAKQFVVFLLSQIMEKINKKSNRKILISLANYLASYISRSVNLSSSFISKTLSNIIKLITELLSSKKPIKNDKKTEKIAKSSLRFEKQIEKLNLSEIFQDNFDILLLLQTALWIWTTRPESRQNNQEQLKKILSECEQQIYYKFFIHQQLLQKCEIIQLQQTNYTYKCFQIVHKFSPITLKRLNLYIGNLIHPYEKIQKPPLKLQFIKSEVKHEASNLQGIPVKRFKSEKKQSQATTI